MEISFYIELTSIQCHFIDFCSSFVIAMTAFDFLFVKTNTVGEKSEEAGAAIGRIGLFRVHDRREPRRTPANKTCHGLYAALLRYFCFKLYDIRFGRDSEGFVFSVGFFFGQPFLAG